MTTDDDNVKINETNNDANDRNGDKNSKNGNEKERITIPPLEQAIMNASASVKHMMENSLS